jgi:hypothetical protein
MPGGPSPPVGPNADGDRPAWEEPGSFPEIPEGTRILVLVEGKDDVGLLQALGRCVGVEGLFVLGVGGFARYSAALSALRKTQSARFAKIGALGLVKETDTHCSPQAAFASACATLERADLPAPTESMHVVPQAADRPALGVLLVPSPQRLGCIEDVCLDSVADDPATRCVQDFFDCLHEKSTQKPKRMSKAMLQVFLASRPEVGMSLGVAAQSNQLRLDHPAFSQIRQFLQMLSDAAK